MGREKVFIDSSVFIAALLSTRGGSFFILNDLRNEYQLIANEYVTDGVFRILDSKFSKRRALRYLFHLLIGLAEIKIVSNPSKGIVDRVSGVINKEDAPILAAAISELSNYLVTLDNDFLENNVVDFADTKRLNILKPGTFINIHRSK